MNEDEAKALAAELGDGWEALSGTKAWYVRHSYAGVHILEVGHGFYRAHIPYTDYFADGESPREALQKLDDLCWSAAKRLRDQAETMTERARKVRKLVE